MSKVISGALGKAVITGASSGIGKVYADRLAARGYHLLLVARRGDRLKPLADDLTSRYGVEVDFLVADLASSDGLLATVKKVAVDPSVTLLLNNAGVLTVGNVANTSLETLTGMIALNITALSLSQ